MRAVVQRCNWCKITLENGEVSETGKGLVVLLGVGKEDNDNDVNYIADKVMNMRVFEDENQKMNLSLKDVNGELAIVSQGRRPSFFEAEAPERANELYNQLVERCRDSGVHVKTGEFQTYMKINLENDGPVTILLDSKRNF